jgi:hypothetical protein
MSPTAVLNLHIKNYFPYFNIILAHTEFVTFSPHKELCPYEKYGKYGRKVFFLQNN